MTIAKWLNVQDFGATGDGVTDDIVAINDALAAAQYGGTVLFPTGTYLVSSPVGLWGDSFVIDPTPLPDQVTRINLIGLSGNYGSVIKSAGAFPPLAGIFWGCRIQDLCFDVDGNGASAADVQLDQCVVEHCMFRGHGVDEVPPPWAPIAGVNINNGTYSTGLGYVNVVTQCFVSLPGPGLYAYGFSVGYRFSDSWGIGNNVESTEANLLTEGRGQRWIGNHFDGGYPRHNVQSVHGIGHTLFSSNIMELAREEAIKIEVPTDSWYTDYDLQLHFNDNIINNGGRDDPEAYDAVRIVGQDEEHLVRGLQFTSNHVAITPDRVGTSGWNAAVRLKWVDEFTLSTNSWYLNLNDPDPVTLEECGATYDVVGNGGRNSVNIV